MISVYNRQRTIPVDSTHIHRDAQTILRYLDYTEYELNIVITSDAVMRRYNKKFRQIDAVTDILSFPYYPLLKPGERISPSSPEERMLGDLLIAAPYTLRSAQEDGIDFAVRLRELLVHGIFHLLGYNHVTDEEFQAMNKEENKIIAFLYAER